jgi:ribosomal protein L37AE/L43A
MSTPSDYDPVPNEIPYEVQVCPKCKSTEIDRREGFHPLGRWGCRNCQKSFMISSLQIRILPATEAPPRHWHWQ